MQGSSFKENSTTLSQALLLFAGVCMVGLSIYLTTHYFNVKFPTGLGASSICDINSFFSCDTATHSTFSNIMGIPISIFGALMGCFVLVGFLFGGENFEGTNYFLLLINALGCLFLFLYSLIILGALCPFCSLYYLASWIAFGVLFKNSVIKRPDVKVLAGYAVVAAAISFVTYGSVQEKTEKTEKMAVAIVKAYDDLGTVGDPKVDSPYAMVKATEKFADSPIRITKFSDFQCPACKMLSKVLHQVQKKYKGKVSIQYMFYPLDHNCNPSMKRPLHQYACQASYLASCLPNKFPEVEEKLFLNQKNFSTKWMNDYAKEEGVTECMNSKETKAKVADYINQAGGFNVKSTPTFILNGKKIEGSLAVPQMYAIIDAILKRAEK